MKANITFLYFYLDLDLHEIYMSRCLQLAELGNSYVAPNPMVGAILVFNNKIIGEGYHQQYGKAHAEVNCIDSVKEVDKNLIADSILYVSMEPCNHFGQTPPCTELIIKNKIKQVIIGCRDPFKPVSSANNKNKSEEKGVDKLIDAGVQVTTGVLQSKCLQLNKRFLTFHQHQRPYIILKWAQTIDGKIGNLATPSGTNDHVNDKVIPGRLKISHHLTDRIVHQWRSEEMGILVGTKTASTDNPELTVRHWPGNNPVRLVIDKYLLLDSSLHLLDNQHATIVFNYNRHTLPETIVVSKLRTAGTYYYRLIEDEDLVPQLLKALHHLQITSVLVEGGRSLLQSIIDIGSWDEARVISNELSDYNNDPGLFAPVLKGHQLLTSKKIATDVIRFYRNVEAVGD